MPTCTQSSSHVTLISVELYTIYVLTYTSFDEQKRLVPKRHSILQVKVTALQTILSITRSRDVLISTEATGQKLGEVKKKYQQMAQEMRNTNCETFCSVGWSVTQQLCCLSCHTAYGSVLICPPRQAGRIHFCGLGTPYSRVCYPHSWNDRDSGYRQRVSTVCKHSMNYLGGEGDGV